MPTAEAPSLESAITQAVESHKADLPAQDLSEVKLPSGDEEIVERTTTTEEPETEVEVDQDAEYGRTLVQALRDPARAPYVIDMLARQAGYTKETINTKTDVKEAKADLINILEAELGDELKFLAPRLGRALDKYLEKTRTEQVPNTELADLRARVENREKQEVESEILTVHTSISQEYFGADDMPADVAKALSVAMDQFPPNDPNMKPTTYYRKIFSLVAGERGLSKKNATRETKITRSRDDATARQLSANNRGVTPSVNGNARKMTLDDSVKRAIAQLDETTRK
jgi:hypothetical protein